MNSLLTIAIDLIDFFVLPFQFYGFASVIVLAEFARASSGPSNLPLATNREYPVLSR